MKYTISLREKAKKRFYVLAKDEAKTDTLRIVKAFLDHPSVQEIKISFKEEKIDDTSQS